MSDVYLIDYRAVVYLYSYGDRMTEFFGISFIILAFVCYYFARRYNARDIVLSIASILAFCVGVALLAYELFK